MATEDISMNITRKRISVPMGRGDATNITIRRLQEKDALGRDISILIRYKKTACTEL